MYDNFSLQKLMYKNYKIHVISMVLWLRYKHISDTPMSTGHFAGGVSECICYNRLTSTKYWQAFFFFESPKNVTSVSLNGLNNVICAWMSWFYEMRAPWYSNLVLFYPFLRAPGNIHSNTKKWRQNQKYCYEQDQLKRNVGRLKCSEWNVTYITVLKTK